MLGHVVELPGGYTDACCSGCFENVAAISLASIHEGDVEDEAPPLCFNCGDTIEP